MKQRNLVVFAALFVAMMTGLSGVASAGAGPGENDCGADGWTGCNYQPPDCQPCISDNSVIVTNIQVDGAGQTRQISGSLFNQDLTRNLSYLRVYKVHKDGSEEPVYTVRVVLKEWETKFVFSLNTGTGDYIIKILDSAGNLRGTGWFYFLVETPACVNNKKMEKFSNLEGGYGFEHPSCWFTVIGTPSSDKNTIFGPEARDGFALGGVAALPHTGSLKEYIEGRGTYLGLFYIDQKKIKVDGHEAISAKDKASGNPIVFVKGKDDVYTIYFNSNKSDEVKLFNKLVKSFEVLEPEIKISFDKKTKVVTIVSKNIPNDPYHHFAIEYKYPGDTSWRGLLAYGTTNGMYSFTIGSTGKPGVYNLKIPLEIKVTAFREMTPFLSQTLLIKR